MNQKETIVQHLNVNTVNVMVSKLVTQADIDSAMLHPVVQKAYKSVVARLRKPSYLRILPFSEAPKNLWDYTTAVCVASNSKIFWGSYDIYIQNPFPTLEKTIVHELMHVEQDIDAGVWQATMQVPFLEHDANVRAGKYGFVLIDEWDEVARKAIAQNRLISNVPLEQVMGFLSSNEFQRNQLAATITNSPVFDLFLNSFWATHPRDMQWDPKDLKHAGKDWTKWVS